MGKYLLLGYGVSNKSIEKFFISENIGYDIYDDFIEDSKNIKNDFNIDDYDIIVKSGSVTNEHLVVKKAKESNVKIVSDLELFYKFSKKRKLIVITGTNGKSTTCNLLSQITGYSLAGNIGIPLFDYIYTCDPLIIEVSSYMSEYLYDFKADIYGIINIFPNHLDHHHTYAEYSQCKFNLFRNITENDFLFYNSDNNDIEKNINNIKCNKIPFSLCNIDNGYIKVFGKRILSVDKINSSLSYNLENVLLTIKIAMFIGIDEQKIINCLINYQSLNHRLSFIFNYKGVDFYNDSKATNLYAMKKAYERFKDKKLLLICGGKDGYLDYNLLNSINPYLILINGENRNFLESFFSLKGLRVYKFATLKELLDNLEKYLEEVEVVLFSPGFQSFDQFTSFEKRGLFFESYLKSLYFL